MNVLNNSVAPDASSATNHNPYAMSEEFEFFEKVKKALGNKNTYSEFLKVLNLFNQDILDPKMLVHKVEPFLARFPDLFEWFKVFVKFDEPADEGARCFHASYFSRFVEFIPAEAPRRDLTNSKRSGSSYRQLPKDVCTRPRRFINCLVPAAVLSRQRRFVL